MGQSCPSPTGAQCPVRGEDRQEKPPSVPDSLEYAFEDRLEALFALCGQAGRRASVPKNPGDMQPLPGTADLFKVTGPGQPRGIPFGTLTAIKAPVELFS